jgi:hypothetical protein
MFRNPESLRGLTVNLFMAAIDNVENAGIMNILNGKNRF